VGVALLLLSGCSTDQPAAAKPLPAAPVIAPPAAAAGGACILLDYGLIKDKIGVKFDIAAADQADTTSTCVVQAEGSSKPDLVFSVVEHTDADAKTYLAELKPAKATTVTGLGAAAYRTVTDGSGGTGPVVELDWLTKAQQAKTLRFTYAQGTSTGDAEKLVDRLVELAKAVDGDGG
jgi:hypothetical protein